MKLKGVEPLNTVIKLPDGRIGTICYNWLDGCGGIWGKKHFDTEERMDNPDLPEPEFMLREKEIEGKLRGLENAECVGEEYEILL
ncbi:MAG: hypothetical protein UT24_C0003G0007 [Candidatus Woesebacteria bacterium GW2011_GWB1_39_12]|uniref:Uncharacterized protein n=1 Tax=Candidatus Woesebacteria bacterium GW2011_GWB1_39_12 TaxID=1618574 RepID=A0A0G0PTV2_9BACT|nr:MAG: hypothetical protein UT24_C0003G0007 [Candidatus Woesebacteria bacterium GW2011_GWB1_39_12]